jgi:hypothetical protein
MNVNVIISVCQILLSGIVCAAAISLILLARVLAVDCSVVNVGIDTSAMDIIAGAVVLEDAVTVVIMDLNLVLVLELDLKFVHTNAAGAAIARNRNTHATVLMVTLVYMRRG